MQKVLFTYLAYYTTSLLHNYMQFKFYCFFVKRVSGRGTEQRESEKTVLYPQIIIILISYIIIYYYYIIKLLITENHPGRNQKRNSKFYCLLFSLFLTNLKSFIKSFRVLKNFPKSLYFYQFEFILANRFKTEAWIIKLFTDVIKSIPK
jgi:hypothetical protein